MLDELSALSVQAFLCEPANPAASGDEHGQALKRLQGCIAGAESGVWFLNQLPDLLDDLYPSTLVPNPKLIQFSQAVYCRQAGRALFNSITGLALPGTMLTRLPRHQHVPDVQVFKLDLIHSRQTFSRLQKAVFLPAVNCQDKEHWFGETHAYLWPFLPSYVREIQGSPVILGGCDPDQPYAAPLVRRIRKAHCFPIFEKDLPNDFIIEKVVVPQPSYRLLAGFRKQYFQACRARCQRKPPVGRVVGAKVCIAPVYGEVALRFRQVYRLLVQIMRERGWSVIASKSADSLKAMRALDQAETILVFDGPDVRLLASLGANLNRLKLIVVGEGIGVNNALQLRTQNARGLIINPGRIVPPTDNLANLPPRFKGKVERWLARCLAHLDGV